MNQMISLNGTWWLTKHRYSDPLTPYMEENFLPEGWLQTQVPEDVRTALRRNGLISGHYLGKDLDTERWIDISDWVYYRRFFAEPSLRGKSVFLQFDGIDTLAEIWLNGKKIATSSNMFTTVNIDVTNKLLYGQTNTLLVHVISPELGSQHISREGLYPVEDTTRLVMRKSQMNFGWDFCGHCLTTGLWKDVALHVHSNAYIEDIWLRTDLLAPNYSTMALSTTVNHLGKEEGDDLSLQLTFTGDKQPQTFTFPIDGKEHLFTLKEPRLWWPTPYGDPFLYQVTASLFKGDTLIDQREWAQGVRTIRLLQEPLKEGGRSFLFEVNGRKIFTRGANWVPMNAVYGDIKKEDYDQIFARVMESNISMLRIWGGGIYEPDYFFDLCDRYGILVFQDFMLACGVLPQTEDYLAQVTKEIEEIVIKYRGRTSLAIWSADNELDEAYKWYDIGERFKENKVNRIAVAQAVAKFDPHRPFLVSSPCSPFEQEPGGDDPNAHLQGDMHVYLTGYTQGGDTYYKHLLDYVPRFMSEYGFCSLPGSTTYGQFNFFERGLDLDKNPWLSRNPSMIQRCTTKQGAIQYTQFAHGHALKYWIEYMRSHKWVCGGSLYWKFNDPIAPNRPNMLFPTLMSALDFYGVPKLAYYYARRAYEDVLLAFRENHQGDVEVVWCSEKDSNDTGEVTISLLDFNGTPLAQYTQAVTLQGDSAQSLFTLSHQIIHDHPVASCYIKAEFVGEKYHLVNRLLPHSIGEWIAADLPKAQVKAHAAWNDKEQNIYLALSTKEYACDIMVEIPGLDHLTFYSDNALTLDAGEEKTITISNVNKTQLQNFSIKVSGINVPAFAIDTNQFLFG